MNNFEKLGIFYLGRNYDLNTSSIRNEYVLYDSTDLTTHAVCVGMTGSGKTGLCIDLLEEAAIDNVPSIIIDPKGDITNLMLTFPNLSKEDFLPWINKSDAKRKNMSEEEFAESQATLWKKGLKEWDQDGNRIEKLKNSAEFNIYTPGSNAGIPISILDSFQSPHHQIIDDSDSFNDRISSTTSSLLGLLGIEDDPLKSKEHILLANIFKTFWSKEEDLDLPGIINSVQNPPFNKIGVFELNTFYPEKERFALAMQLNNILSAPGFQSWLSGETLEIDKILYSNEGKPRVSIFYTAHLSDAERMFFTSLLLNQLLGWMRMQSGTTSLRALLYVDEIFGYLPPVSNPPTKKPFLMLLKQARAFGLGLVLATQNPVDLDYKSLSNAGTWFLGRLQTERDRKRVLDGLEGASLEGGGKFNKFEIERILSNLDKRVFLLHNVNEDHPQVFYSRWAMSYLRGPLTRTQIKSLTKRSDLSDNKELSASVTSSSINKPNLPKEIKPLYLKRKFGIIDSTTISYKPFIINVVDVRFYDRTKKIDSQKTVCFITAIKENVIPVNWDEAVEIIPNENMLKKRGDTNIGYIDLPSSALEYKNYKTWERFFIDHLASEYYVEVYYSPSLKVTSNPGEDVRDFKIRLSHMNKEDRDEAVSKLRDRFASRILALQGRIQRAEERIEREKSQSTQQKLSTAISIGSTIFGVLFGRKKISTTTISKAGTAMRSAGKVIKESGDISRAKENLLRLKDQLIELEEKLQDEIDKLEEKFDLSVDQIESVKIRPRKTNISIKLFNFVWIPLGVESLHDIEEIELV